ncbi:hypothetical protein ACFOKF_13380 [Sphingobium rhizovicinum]|uniref:Transposase n=1 Tax=Sphingobium rhizovicinum TaxID=432308 RepID=A0ABV7NG46_9SPHN
MAAILPEQSFANAFTSWLDAVADVRDIMVVEPCADRDAVDIKFVIGDGALHGYAHSAGISISALWDGECWDFLFDRDVVAECGSKGWFCTLCPTEERSFFPAIECLWEDHLFHPLRDWITTQLIPAKAIVLHGDGGATWARLIEDDNIDNQSVPIVLLDLATPSQ